MSDSTDKGDRPKRPSSDWTAEEVSAELDKLLKSIEKGVPAVEAEKVPDKKDIQEIIDYEAERKAAAVHNEWMLIDLRKKYGRNIIRFLWVYFTFAALAVTASALGWVSVPESVLVAIIGGTAVSVLGVVGTVAAGLFKPPSPPAS